MPSLYLSIMEKKYKMSKKEREEEIQSRIVRDEVPPVLLGNGVHREVKNEAQKIANDQTMERAQKEVEDQSKGAMKVGKMIREDQKIVKEN